MANLSLKHIYKVYSNGAKAVNDFNMEIDDKEFIVFVGPSGCGKSTTLRMIAGLEEITSGELKIGGKIVNRLEPKDRDIAMVFQNYALYPHMTIYDNIAFGLRMRKTAKAETDKRVREAAEILGITEYLKRKPKEMSGGQRQRVALGRAIVREPKVMLLDEPLSNLDAKLRTQMRSEIVKLHKKLQTTFIYVTHDQVEAMTMGTRIVVMKDGFIKQIDTPKNLYKYPANKFVAGFIGTPQMNFFKGTLKKEGNNVIIRFDNSDAEVSVPYSFFIKINPEYFDGAKPVYIGLRAEDISLDEQKVAESKAKIKVKISHSEELGTETLVYGDINILSEDFAETDTRIIIKAAGFKDFKQDGVREAALNISAIHFFDAETEEDIMPRVPQNNFLDCMVQNGYLIIAGNKLKLPPALQCGDGFCRLTVPLSAVNFAGNIKAEVIDCERVNGRYLITAYVNGVTVFALSDESVGTGAVKIGIDLKKVTLKTDTAEFLPLPYKNNLCGKFIFETAKETVNVNGKNKTVKVPRYYLDINGNKFEAPEEVCEKLFSALPGKKVYGTEFIFGWAPYDFKIAERGIVAEVCGVLDYGGEKFCKCTAAEEIIYIKCDKDLSGKIYIAPDVVKVSISEAASGIKIV